MNAVTTTAIRPEMPCAIHLSLIDAVDLLREARQINEAAFMACRGLGDRKQMDALQRIIGLCGDTLRNVADNLEAFRDDAKEGGAA